MSGSVSPLAATLARFDAAHPYCAATVGTPVGPRWTCVRELLDDQALLRGVFEGLSAESNGVPDVAAAYLASWIGGIVIDPVGWAVGVERRAWPLDPGSLWIHRHEDGWFDGFAIASPSVRVLPDDPAAGHPEAVVVDDVEALRASVARDAVALLGPLYATIRTFAPYGIRGMWGATADSVGSSAALDAFRRGSPEESAAAFDDAMRLVDQLTAAGAGRITRPAPEALACSSATTTIVHKGTCCLWYKTCDESAPIGDRYCLSCPVQPDPEQHDRWVRWLDQEAATRGDLRVDDPSASVVGETTAAAGSA